MNFFNFFNFFRRLGATYVGIDLGTANTLICVNGQIILEEPSVVAVNKKTKKVIVGKEAKDMLGKTSEEFTVARPMRDGKIHKYHLAIEMLSGFLKKSNIKTGIFKNINIIIAVPLGLEDVGKEALKNALERMGFNNVWIIPSVLAAAIGANLPIEQPHGGMIIDSGGGTTEVAVISLGHIAQGHSIEIAGDEITAAIMDGAEDRLNLIIDELTAEKLKIELGSVLPFKEEKSLVISGKDKGSKGIPRQKNVTSTEVREWIKPCVEEITKAIVDSFKNISAAHSDPITQRGLTFTGGTSLLSGLIDHIHKQTNLKVTRVPDPLRCVAIGLSTIIGNIDRYSYLLKSIKDNIL